MVVAVAVRSAAVRRGAGEGHLAVLARRSGHVDGLALERFVVKRDVVFLSARDAHGVIKRLLAHGAIAHDVSVKVLQR